MKIPKKLIDLSSCDNGSLIERALKLNEESGEVAEAVLRASGRKNNRGRSKKKMDAHIVEEAIDVMIMTMDILTYMQFTDDDKIEKLINKKLNKWERSIATRKRNR